jgi:hypothetical protein
VAINMTNQTKMNKNWNASALVRDDDDFNDEKP